jgi:predicted DNA binding CopG/RHH family protein
MTARQKTKDEQIFSGDSFQDPYDAMNDEEFGSYVDRLFSDSQGPTRSITIRMPEDLLNRIQRIASRRRVPYQRLMKRMLEESVSGLERRAAAATRTVPRNARAPAAKPRTRER